MAVKKDQSNGKAGRDIKTSRRVAGLSVILSVVAAATLLGVANVAVHLLADKTDSGLRWDVGTVSKYGLSDSSKRILRNVEQPVRITSIYTATDEDMNPRDFLPRIRDLLAEMQQIKKDLTVDHATNDRQKAQVLARLRDRLDKLATKHRAVIGDFQKLVSQQLPLFTQMADEWRRYQGEYVNQFRLAKTIETMFTSAEASLRKLSLEFRTEVEGTSSLPDYPRMARKLRVALVEVQERLGQIVDILTGLAKLPAAAEEARPQLLTESEAVTASITELLSAVGKPGTPLPSNPGAELDKIIDAATQTAKAGRKVLLQLQILAARGYPRLSPAWRTPQGSLPEAYNDLAMLADQLVMSAKSTRDKGTVEFQNEVIANYRENLPKSGLAQRARQTQDALKKLLDMLIEVDEPTQKILAQAAKDSYLADLRKPVETLLARADDLGGPQAPQGLDTPEARKELEDLQAQQELVAKTTQDNIVIVEVGDKTAVVNFEEVWPLSARGAEEDRVFNGDMAINSRIFSLSASPLGEVVLTFFEVQPPPQMRRFQLPVEGLIPTRVLRTLRERITRANVSVTEWNLAQSPVPPPGDGSLPRVLLILPPPPPAFLPRSAFSGQQPRWSEVHEQAVKKVIDEGTPAIFLASFFYLPESMRARGEAYALGEYLRRDWGLNVETDLRVVETARDPDNPGKYELPVRKWQFMGLSAFTDHPVGKPLKARRFYWLEASPIRLVEQMPAGVKVEDILVVPAGRDEIWAVADIDGFINRVRAHKPLEPLPGDIRPEFPLVVEATRQAGGQTNRIIVIAAAASYVDSYLTQPVLRIKEDGTIEMEPPPSGNTDLVTNSIYHLLGQERYIGTAAASGQPIQLDSDLAGLKLAYDALLALGIVLTGVLVVFLRRR